jgi:hypothetical protein
MDGCSHLGCYSPHRMLLAMLVLEVLLLALTDARCALLC